jgi:hypothetical protein
MTTPYDRTQMEQFAADVEGTVYFLDRHVAKRLGGKWLRGKNVPLEVLAEVRDDLGNTFVLLRGNKRVQLSPEEYNQMKSR